MQNHNFLSMHFYYQLNNEDKIMDLVALFDEKLSFKKHIEITISKAYYRLGSCNESMLGIYRSTTLKALYFEHVRSFLE